VIYDAAKDGRAKIIDVDTGERITYITWADTDAGEYEEIVFDGRGLMELDVETNRVKRRRVTGRRILVLRLGHPVLTQ
jgi:hypothetical protein